MTPDLVDPTSDRPLPDREREGNLQTSYRVGVALKAHDWERAERLQRTIIDHEAPELADTLNLPPSQLDEDQRTAVINFC